MTDKVTLSKHDLTRLSRIVMDAFDNNAPNDEPDERMHMKRSEVIDLIERADDVLSGYDEFDIEDEQNFLDRLAAEIA